MIDRRLLLGGAIASVAGRAAAQSTLPRTDYPTGPIALSLPVAAGEVADLSLRALLAGMARDLFWQFRLSNEPNAVAAATAAAHAAADGYHLFLGTQDALAAAPEIARHSPYDPATAFEPIVGLCTVPLVFAASRSLPAQNLRDLVQLTRTQPPRYRYGSLGEGSVGHLAGELFKLRTGTVASHVAFSGTGAIVQALVAGKLDFAILPVAPVWQAWRNGQVKLFAQMGEARYKALVGLPTIRESGIANAAVTSWFALMAPTGIAAPTADLLASTFTAALTADKNRALLDRCGLIADPRSLAGCRTRLAADRKLFAEIVRLQGLKQA